MKLTVDHLGIVSNDVPRSIAFYLQLLSGTVAPMAGHSVVSAGDLRIAIVPRRDDDPSGYARGHHLALRVPAEARAELLGRLTALGLEHEQVHGRIYTRDPDGLTLEFLFE